MTLPDERFRALKQGKKLLEELCDPGKTPRVPSLIRDRARAALRHYPADFDLDGNINLNGLYDTLAHNDWSAVFVNGIIPCFLQFLLLPDFLSRLQTVV